MTVSDLADRVFLIDGRVRRPDLGVVVYGL